ncbi:hypothetical protein [Oscillatoria sp. HE19RPO]|uniref:hypothetical protein n=1 Tax=Oscillatoria sp. HE19RPO TaxID=2954806 RepID=UPI0020C4FD0E|nr:hypothetical protein [Oscillatoria sp. HE19RPO]
MTKAIAFVTHSFGLKRLYGGWVNLFLGDVAMAQEEPHPNPPLAKGRGPEVSLNVRQLPLTVKNYSWKGDRMESGWHLGFGFPFGSRWGGL